MDFDTGTIWAPYPHTVTADPMPAGYEMYEQASVVFNTAGTKVTPQGLLVRLQISTVGINSGTFALSFKSTDVGADSAFILPSSTEFTSNITNGSLIVAVVPPAPVITGITTDTGSSAADGITNDTMLLINGTANAHRFRLRLQSRFLG
ncbi:MAG: hypothetical protein NTY19_07625 [Planctomycetota bacterium]|nr:hypothetical protein [Planctomycetota bacterium]